LWTRSPRKPPA
jgi:putative transposase